MAKQPGRKTTKKARSKAAANAAAPAPRSPGKHSNHVITIRALDPQNKEIFEASLLSTAKLEQLAEKWTYILRARSRWAHDIEQRKYFGSQAVEDLKDLGVKLEFIERLSTVIHIEVELHPWDTQDAEAARIGETASEIPWEYLISAATRSVGRFQPLLITRLFRNGRPPVALPPPELVLFVESAPGRLKDLYEFDDEEDRIRAAVNATGVREGHMEILNTPQLSELSGHARRRKWEAIHVSGVDTQQAGWFLEGFYKDLREHHPDRLQGVVDSSDRLCDGMLLREGREIQKPVCFGDLADALVNPAAPPYVVTLNLYYSGARTARELVKRGAHAALGFLDEIKDELAERFFQAFYWGWCRPGDGRTISNSFLEAWEAMKDEGLHGTSIAIWMGNSVFEEVPWLPSKAKRKNRTTANETESREDRLERFAAMPINKVLQVDFDVDDEVNYSLLHNNRELVSKLTLTKLVDGTLEDITVRVELCVGAQNYPYRYTHLVLDEVQLALAPQIKIPLTANLQRSLRERVQSTVYVKVTCCGRTAWEETRRVTLIPVDEWVDDTNNNPWLPSFVLPRDPAILEIINASRRYLIGITDDPAAGFDGYQSEANAVDKQVQAIWTALVNEYRLQYINPPPAYSQQSQRLRTPSEILASKSGTCIDLALLIASCLEYIGVYPVLVLLTGHAFVGYWRSEEAHDSLVSIETIPSKVPVVGDKSSREGGLPYVDPYGWRLTRLNLDEIKEYVASGDLIMLEATFLTGAYGFHDAMKEGRANLRSRKEFDSLLDIQLARTADPAVTPLPIINE